MNRTPREKHFLRDVVRLLDKNWGEVNHAKENFFLIDPIGASGFEDEFILLVADGKYAANLMVLTDEVRLSKRVILRNLIYRVISNRTKEDLFGILSK